MRPTISGRCARAIAGEPCGAKRLRPGRPADPVISQRQSDDRDDDADDEPHSLARHETAGKHARPLQDPHGANQDGNQADNQAANTHTTTVRAGVALFPCRVQLAREECAAALRPLRFRRDGLGRNHALFAGAAAGFDLGQRQLTNIQSLDGGEVAERPQEVLPAATLYDAAELVFETLDAFNKRNPEGIGDPRALRTELFLDELLRIAGETLVAHD